MTLNGLIPLATLAPVRTHPGAYLRSDAEASWHALCDEVQRLYGWRPTLTSAADAYRPYAVQERIFRQRYTTARATGIDPRGWDSDGNGVKETWWRLPVFAAAAVPGTSTHGLGTTVDVAGLRYGTTRFTQFAKVAARHGWSNAEGRQVNEAWHWSKVTAGAARPAPPATTRPIPAPAPEEDIMASLEQLDALLTARLATLPQPAAPVRLCRIEGTSFAWLDLGVARRPWSDAEHTATPAPVVPLPVGHPFWRLPIVGTPYAIGYRRTGKTDVWFGEVRVVEAVGEFVRAYRGAEHYAVHGRPPFVDLDPGHPFWSLPPVGIDPPEGR